MNNHDTPIDKDIYKSVTEFICKCASFYKTESLRLHAIESPLVDIWGHFSALKVGIGDSACDGNLVTNVDGQVAYRMILEAKNEIGLGGCDPTIQMSLYYRNYWSQKTSQRIVATQHLGLQSLGPGYVFLELSFWDMLWCNR